MPGPAEPYTLRVWLATISGMPGMYADAVRCVDCTDSLPTTFDRTRAWRFETKEGAQAWCEKNPGFEPIEVELWEARSL